MILTITNAITFTNAITLEMKGFGNKQLEDAATIDKLKADKKLMLGEVKKAIDIGWSKFNESEQLRVASWRAIAQLEKDKENLENLLDGTCGEELSVSDAPPISYDYRIQKKCNTQDTK